MAKILILYGTTEGYTSILAAHVAEVVRADGHGVEVRDVSRLPSGFTPEGFDGVIVGGSVHYGEDQQDVRDFVKNNLAFLKRVPSAFFSVRAQLRNKGYVERFTQETGWKPEQVATFAGAVAYGHENNSFYINQLARLFYFLLSLIRLVSKRKVSVTYLDGLVYLGFTDWEEIRRFTERFLARFPRTRTGN